MSRRAAPRPPRRTPPLALDALERRVVPADFTVTTTLDAHAADLAPGQVSLRSAIDAVNAGGDAANTITLPAGTYTLTLAGRGDDANLGGDLDVLRPVAIRGAGAGVTVIDAARLDRAFHFAGAGDWSLAGLTVRGGLADDGRGGGILAESFAGGLTLTACVVTDNVVFGDPFAGAAAGGGIYNAAAGGLRLAGCTVSGNRALGTLTPFGGAARGGGVYDADGSAGLFTDTVFSGNRAVGAGGGAGRGGAVYHEPPPGNEAANPSDPDLLLPPLGDAPTTLALDNVTVADNLAAGGPGDDFSGSAGDAQGGGVWARDAALTVVGSRFLRNRAEAGDARGAAEGALSAGSAAGGGLYAESTAPGASVAVADTRFEGNEALGGDNAERFGNGRAGSASGGAVALVHFDSFDSGPPAASFVRVALAGNRAVGGSVAPTGAGFLSFVVAGAAAGGGLFAAGYPTALLDAVVADNLALGGSVAFAPFSGQTFLFAGDATGGGVHFEDRTTFGTAAEFALVRSAVVRNAAAGGDASLAGGPPDGNALAAGGAFGGGVYLASRAGGTQAAPALLNTTVSGNLAAGGRAGGVVADRSGPGAAGGGVYADSRLFVVANSTVAFNALDAGDAGPAAGGGLAAVSVLSEGTVAAGLVVASSIVARNAAGAAGDDLFGDVLSLGDNLVGVAPAGFAAAAGDQLGTAAAPLDPRLGALAANGGPTPTHALLDGSPALDAGADPFARPTDQRGPGFARTSGAGTDVGAFERQVVPNQTPAAALDAAADVTTPGVTLYTFTVAYADPDGTIDLSTLGDDDILVTGPNGFSQVARFVGVESTAGGVVIVRYAIVPPGGAFDPADDGTYTIGVLTGSVGDAGDPQLFVPAGPLGDFLVAIPVEELPEQPENPELPGEPVVPEAPPVPVPPVPQVIPLPFPPVVVSAGGPPVPAPEPAPVPTPRADRPGFFIFPNSGVPQGGGAGTGGEPADDPFTMFDPEASARALARGGRPGPLDPAVLYGPAYRPSGYSLPGEIRGQIFTDLDGDGVRGDGEPYRAGVVVFVDANENGEPDPEERWTVTDDAGRYEFLEVEAGRHPVRVAFGGRTDLTFPQKPVHVIHLTGARKVATGVDFGLRDRRLRRRGPNIGAIRPAAEAPPVGSDAGWASVFLVAALAPWAAAARRHPEDRPSRAATAGSAGA